MTTEQLIKKANSSQKKHKIVENKISKKLHTIGIVTIVLGIIGSIILSASFDGDVPIILIVGGFTSIVTGMCVIGFSEIIALLQKNVNQQNEIINIVKNCMSEKTTD